ncbi:MAG: methionyl-tRNA formyltransferase [Buchnera aphidicola (Kaburagia rhusicola rhusicola)]
MVFSGTSNFSEQHLKQLIYYKYKIVGVITQPDRPSGRGKKIIESPVKKTAKKYNIPVFQPENLNNSILYNQLYKLHANLMIVVSYGLIIPKNILNIFSLGCINIHASLLPRWRGAAPVQSAILNGDLMTGITIIQMDEGIDTGKILYSMPCKIETFDTSQSLQNKLGKIGCQAILFILTKLELGQYNAIVQSKLTTYSHKIKKQDAQLNWLKDAKTLEQCIRAFNPWPISFFKIKKEHIKVWKANVIIQKNINLYCAGEIILINKNGLQIQTKKNILNITHIQLPGKKVINAYDLNNSKNHWFAPNIRLI